jgi:hypothetical protein
VDAAYFRAKALHCRELAFTAPDLETQAGLLALADEYLKRALEESYGSVPFPKFVRRLKCSACGSRNVAGRPQWPTR